MKDAEIIINDVVKGEYDLPRQFAPVIHEIPDATSKNAGKSLTVDKDGRPTWGEGGGSIQHDWYQNDSTAADYIKNRPGGYTKTTPGYEITWDGVVGDKVVVDVGEAQLVKVSDRVFTVEELIGATVTLGDRSFTINNDNIQSQNGAINGEIFLVCSAPTTIEGITFTETGTYFMKTGEGFVSSISKPDSTTTIKIPAELTTVVGGYDTAERTAVIFDGTVKASDFVDVKTLQTGRGATEPYTSAPKTEYAAPITLATSLIPGSIFTGTVNGVEVIGGWDDAIVLYDVDDNIVLTIEAIGNMTVCVLPDASIPASDLVISLTQSFRGGPVVIPKKYLDLDDVNSNLYDVNSNIQNIQNTLDNVVTDVNTVRTAAYAAKTTSETAIVPALMLTITWDGTTNGKTKFTTSKNENFYKMSSLKIPIGAFVGTYKRSDTTFANELFTIKISQDCYRYGNDIVVVLKPGTYVDNIMLGEFTASEPGVYFQARQYVTSYTLTINYEVDPYYNALLMMSSDGTKKFKITIDDTGTIKATEVTE